jgi:MFS superfamily sulfate permease-like transporter
VDGHSFKQTATMDIINRRTRFYFLSFLKHDFKASITVFFVALPLCLGISLASGAPIYSGLISGIVGGIIVTLISKSHLSVSGPAAGLTAISAAAIAMGNIHVFFLSVALSGLLQIFLGVFKLGGFTHFIPSTVIKGMLAAIGIILISKQVPFLLGYDKADFWTKELFNILSFRNGFEHVRNIYYNSSRGAILIAFSSLGLLILWQKKLSKKFSFFPSSFVIVLFAVLLALFFKHYIPVLALKPTQFVNVPGHLFAELNLPEYNTLFSNTLIWKNAVVICMVASLETLLSIEAVDKLDPYNRITPQNRELVAQGTGNFISGLLGGLPITAVIVRSSANAEAGARTKLSSFFHGIWLLVLVFFAANIVNLIPYCVLAVILIRTGYNLAKPKMIRSVYKLGREQFIPFIVTVLAILFTDLLIGVCIGVAYAGYFIFKNTYKAGFKLDIRSEGQGQHYYFLLAINVSFINKKKLKDELEKIPDRSIVHIEGGHCVYIDYDVIEVINEFKTKAHHKHIELHLSGIPDVETIEAH